VKINRLQKILILEIILGLMMIGYINANKIAWGKVYSYYEGGGYRINSINLNYEILTLDAKGYREPNQDPYSSSKMEWHLVWAVAFGGSISSKKSSDFNNSYVLGYTISFDVFTGEIIGGKVLS
jgi:hypothetical protein